MPSPYQVVLGDAIDALPDSLRRYFSEIPPGHVGRGRGVFSEVGTPRRWLWPIIAVMGRGGAMFPVWEHDVPFVVENRPVLADGRPAIAAVRTFRLAGRSVNCRYTPANRAEILRSRIETTRELGRAIASAAAPPPLWVNSSTATIYRHAEDRPMTESTGELGEGFSVGIARAWEAELAAAATPATRRVALRMAIVLGDGAVLETLLRLARAGLGGPNLDGFWPATRARLAAGTYHVNRRTHGHQRFSWIHEADVHGIIRFLQARPELDGAINASSPEPRDNVELQRLVRAAAHAPIGIPLRRWMLELGAIALRTETELVLKSRWVVPERLERAGYAFRHRSLEGAISEVVARGGTFRYP